MICIDWVTILHFAAFLIYLLFAAAVYQGGISRMRQRMLLFLFLSSFAFDSLVRTIFFNNCAGFSMASIGLFLDTPCWVINSPLAFLLALGFNGKSRLANNRWLFAGMAAYAAVFMLLTWSGMTHELSKTLFGWKTAAIGTAGFIYSRIDDLFIIGSMAVLGYQTYRERPGMRRKQGIVIFVTGIVTVISLYSLRMVKFPVALPTASNITVLFVVIGVAAAIKFYGFVELTPLFAASAVFNSSSEMMLLIEPDGTMAKVNRAFIEKMKKPESAIEGWSFQLYS